MAYRRRGSRRGFRKLRGRKSSFRRFRRFGSLKKPKKSYKKSIKKMIQKTDWKKQPFQILTATKSAQYTSSQGQVQENIVVFSLESGTCRQYSTQAANGLQTNLMFPSTVVSAGDYLGYDDLTAAVASANQFTTNLVGTAFQATSLINSVNTGKRKIYIDYHYSHLQMRNNSNIGVRIQPYYVVPRNNQSISIGATVALPPNYLTYNGALLAFYNSQIHNGANYPAFPGGPYYWTNVSAPTDIPFVPEHFKFKKMKPFILYPGQTREKKLIGKLCGKERNAEDFQIGDFGPKLSRGIFFFCTGLPGREDDPTFANPSSNVATTVAPAPVSIDCIYSYKLKCRTLEVPTVDNNFGNSTLIPAPTVLPPAQIYVMPAVNPTNVVADG